MKHTVVIAVAWFFALHFPASAGLDLLVFVQDGASLPKVVRDAVAATRAGCADIGTPIPRRGNFVAAADLNRDGKIDYILDPAGGGCAGYCGTRGCSVDVFASTPRGRYRENGFTTFDASPAGFRCGKSGECAIAR